MTALTASPSRRRPGVFLAVGVAVALLLAGGVFAAVQAAAPVLTQPFTPDAANGMLTQPASLDDDSHPAIARLDSSLRDALLAAEAEAGFAFPVASGWRSEAYQRWLFDDAVQEHGRDVAQQFVATVERSNHVAGDAVDIGDLDAQYWLISYGYRFGICQIYANETWHFELATTPGGACPALRVDAAG